MESFSAIARPQKYFGGEDPWTQFSNALTPKWREINSRSGEALKEVYRRGDEGTVSPEVANLLERIIFS